MINITEKAPRHLGLYIHIPFCKTKCLYCDFCSHVSRDEEERAIYVSSLIDEIRERGTREYTVDTVYFGGGTPSLLNKGQIGDILCALRESFDISEDAEITLECNPMTHLDDGVEYFGALRSLGINRLSLGIQSANDSELKLIGRRHSFEDAKATFFAAREAGFENISVDLMFGIPSQTIDSLKESVEALISLGAEHISIYSLQLEEGTPLYRMKDRYSLADDDTVSEMYELVISLMASAGYSHYEISNFSRSGRESRHNMKYWRLMEYIGLGLSAHSDFAGERLENVSDMAKYLAGERIASSQMISEGERETEFIMLGLRTASGISKSEFFLRFGADFDSKYGDRMKRLSKFFINDGEADRVALNEKGFEVSNSILTELLDFDY